MSLDTQTHTLLELCKQIADLATSKQKRYYIGSGFSIDLSLGRISRPHEDIDLFIEDKDSEWWQGQFKFLGYNIGAYDYMKYFPGTFTVSKNAKNEEDFLIEVWAMEYKKDGRLVPPHTSDHPGRDWWEGKNWGALKEVIYEGTRLVIEDPQVAADQKLAHVKHHKERLSPKHVHDLHLLNREKEYNQLIAKLKV